MCKTRPMYSKVFLRRPQKIAPTPLWFWLVLATKICTIPLMVLTFTYVKTIREMSLIFVVFSEKLNFKASALHRGVIWQKIQSNQFQHHRCQNIQFKLRLFWDSNFVVLYPNRQRIAFSVCLPGNLYINF